MRTRRLALSVLATAALAAGLLVASGTGSTTRTWSWDGGVPGDRIAGAAGHDSLRLLAAGGDFVLVAGDEDGTLAIGAGTEDDVSLRPLAALAGDDPLVAFAAASPDGGPQRVVGVARSDVDQVEAVLRDGTTRELPLNEWRAFSYTAPTTTEAAVGLVARSGNTEVGVVRVPQTTAVTARSPPPTAYTISNRGRLVPLRAPRSSVIFASQPYRLYLLATRNGRAFYRVQVTPRFTCWAAGKASRIGEIGTLACPNLVGAYPLQFEDTVYRGVAPPGLASSRGARLRFALVRAGGIAVDQAARMALVDAMGKRLATTPIVDNVFSFASTYPKVMVHLVALDGQGNPLRPRLQVAEHQTSPAGLFGPRAIRVKASRLGAVAQRGASDGVTVSVGSNATVVVSGQPSSDAARRALERSKVGFRCFVITGQNVRKTKSAAVTATWRPPVAFMVLGFRAPFDGCDVQGTHGHRWRDGRGTHSLVEVPLSTRGRVYFEDRAAARDLALFVRSRKTKEIRKLTGARLVTELRRAYGTSVAVLPTRTATAPAGVVGVHVDGTRTVFSERSTTGNRLFVVLERGKIVDQNLRGLALVY